jgi:hypothetical protein
MKNKDAPTISEPLRDALLAYADIEPNSAPRAARAFCCRNLMRSRAMYGHALPRGKDVPAVSS